MTNFAARAEELEQIRRRLYSDPPKTIREARAIQRRVDRLYAEAAEELRDLNVASKVFDRALRGLVRKAAGSTARRRR